MKHVRLLHPGAIVSIVLLGASAIGLSAAITASGAQLRKRPINPPDGLRFPSLPPETESWERFGADPPPLSAEILESLGTRNYMSRQYIKKGSMKAGDPVVLDLHCAYYTGMPDTVPHVPEACFVGGGLTIVSNATLVTIPIDLDRFPPDPLIEPSEIDPDVYGVVRHGRLGPRSDAPGNRVRMPFGFDDLKLRVTAFETPQGQRVLAGYFFIANGWAVSDSLQVRQQAFDLSADYAYYAKVQFTSQLVESPEELGDVAADLLNELMPEIMRRVPDWTEVIAGRYPPTGDEAEATTRARRGTREFEEWKQDFNAPDLPGRRR